jgi:hypothetical protein
MLTTDLLLILKKLLGHVPFDWKKYLPSSASTEPTGTGNEPQDGSIMEDVPTESYGGKNPEGDQLVMNFLKKVASEFGYSVEDAAFFVKNTINSLFKS